jgi:hypothetical protein
MDALTSPVRGVAAAGGQALRAATGALAALRPAGKPLHPAGSVTTGVLHRLGPEVHSGAAWLDEPGQDEVLVRQSRAVGLPGPAPDVWGLALRVPVPGGGHGDLLFATTGRGRLTRFLLTAGRTPCSRPSTTLLPYRTPVGPVVLSAEHHDERTVTLSWARGLGDWTPFATLQLPVEPTRADDEPISFDPVRNPLPGLEVYDWVRRLREPSYLTARRSRHATPLR